MNYLEHLKFNKECIELYMKGNIDKIYNWKIYALIQENIEIYSKLRKSKIKVVRSEINNEKTIFKNSLKTFDSEYKENTIEDFYWSYDNYLTYNK
jgi:hypothetical protein